MRWMIILLLPFIFCYLYNVTFYISENYVKIIYCCFGKEGGRLYFSINGVNYSIEASPRTPNVSDFVIERVEDLLRRGKRIEVWEIFQEPGMINYKDFEKMREEVEKVKDLIERGYFCDEITFKKNVRRFSSKTFGSYVIRFSEDKMVEVNQPCDRRYKVSGMFYCVIDRGKDVEINVRKRIDKTILLGGLIWFITFALILISLRKK